MLGQYLIKDGKENLTSHSGLLLAGELIKHTDLRKRLEGLRLPGCADPEISNADILLSMVGLICLGKPQYEAIEAFRKDKLFSNCLGVKKVPSSSTLRQRIDMVRDDIFEIIREESAKLVRTMAPEITPVSTSVGDYIAMDVDVSPFDNSRTKKEGVSRTYKGMDGYSPNFSYLGTEGFLVNVELREGSQHCQKGTPEFLRSSIRYSKMITTGKLLVRMDSGNDSQENLDILMAENVDCIIKRNLRRESKKAWLELAKTLGTFQMPREGKVVWRGKTYRDIKGNPVSMPIVFEVIERTINKHNEYLVVPDIEVNSYSVSFDVDADEAIWLYQDHGTSEQFHSEIKSDMDLERLPSSYFKSNSVILDLGMLGYNILKICGQESLRKDNGNRAKIPGLRKNVQRRRIRTVIQDLIYMAGRIIRTGRRLWISFGKTNPFRDLWKSIYKRFATNGV